VSWTLPTSLRARLDFACATVDEIGQPIDSLPSRIVEHAVRGHEAEYAALIEAKCSSGFDVEVATSVWVPKAGGIGRYRPVAALGLSDRVLLRALANELDADIPEFERSFEAQQAFQRRPLETEASHIVIADVASFYFFVDHELLASRLVDLTARADTAEATRDVLDGLVGRSYGLPQNFGPSAPLSEAFIGPVDRRMARAGVATFRSNDDFRLCAEGWGAALQALERLQEEVSQVGLDLNGDKSWILKRETYEANLGLADRYLADVLASVEDDFPEVDSYTGAPVEGDADDEPGDEDSEEDAAAEAAYATVFELAAGRRLSDAKLSGFERSANRQALTVALFVLTRIGSAAVVESGAQMTAVDPVLTRQYVNYLRALPADGQTAANWVQAGLGKFHGHAPYWTQAWMVNVLLDPRVDLTEQVIDWLQALLGSRAPAVLRMRAAMALAFHGQLRAQAIAESLDELPAAARPEAVAAIAFAGSASTSTAVEGFADDRLLRWVFEIASQHRSDPSPLL
jgi:hypothetical protein